LATGACPFRCLRRWLRTGDDAYFRPHDPYLQSDAVFAVKDSLICDFVRHDEPDAEARELGIAGPVCRAHFDFRLTRATAPQSTVMDAQRRLAALGARRLTRR